MLSYHYPHNDQTGFTLLEMAVVLVILGFLLGGLLGPLSTQQRNKTENSVQQQLIDIEQALLGFAAANGYLPCPASTASNGLEARNGANNCTSEHGYPPARTLGLQGKYDNSGRLLDPWLGPIRYSLNSAGTWEFAKAIRINGTNANYQICSQASCSNIQAQNIVAVIFSLGENGNQTSTSIDQLENIDSDNIFVSHSLSEKSGSEFDDSLRWISPNILIFQLVNAGQL